jgi:hypothetical protein
MWISNFDACKRRVLPLKEDSSRTSLHVGFWARKLHHRLWPDMKRVRPLRRPSTHVSRSLAMTSCRIAVAAPPTARENVLRGN